MKNKQISLPSARDSKSCDNLDKAAYDNYNNSLNGAYAKVSIDRLLRENPALPVFNGNEYLVQNHNEILDNARNSFVGLNGNYTTGLPMYDQFATPTHMFQPVKPGFDNQTGSASISNYSPARFRKIKPGLMILRSVIV